MLGWCREEVGGRGTETERLEARVDGELVLCACPPTSSDIDVGFFDPVIKVHNE